MIYEFPYPSFPKLTIPDDIPVQICAVKEGNDSVSSAEMIIYQSLQSPIGSPPLTEIIRSDMKILIVVDDISRPTPTKLLLPPILDKLSKSGIKKQQIQILIALGTHRKMTKVEMIQKYGKTVVDTYNIFNHEWDNPSALYHYGKLSDGTEVILNKAMHEADFVIGIGAIAPHPAAGFSGGGKIIAPGVATEEAVGNFHWNSVQVPQCDVLGIRENPMRTQIDQIAHLGGLRFIINAVLDGQNRIYTVVSGDPVLAHREGCKFAMEIFGVPVLHPEKYNIIIADTHPLDQDMWQGVKALCAMDVIAPDRAAIILVTPASEGVAPMHPEILRYGYTTLQRAENLILHEGLSKVAAHNMVQGGRLLNRTHAILVAPTIREEETVKLGFRKALDPQDAFEKALHYVQNILQIPPKVLILRMGGEIAPIPKR